MDAPEHEPEPETAQVTTQDAKQDTTHKTEAIRQFFEAHAGRVYGPVEVAAELKLDPNMTNAIIGRLAAEGFLKKEGRGKFKREPTVTPADLRAVHGAIARVVDSLIGSDVATTMIGGGSLKFQEERGVESVAALIIGVQKVFGKEYADRLVLHAVSGQFGERSRSLLDFVSSGGMVKQ